LDNKKRPNKEYSIRKLKRGVNAEYSNYGAYLKTDTLYFTGTITVSKRRKIELPSAKGKYKEIHLDRIFRSLSDSTIDYWKERKMVDIQPPDDKLSHVFAPYFSLLENRLYFTVSKRAEGNVNHIYVSQLEGQSFQKPEKVNFTGIDDRFSVKNPMITMVNSDRIMFFASNAYTPKDGYDIFYGTVNEYNRVTAIKELGKKINTPKNEISPFYDQENNILYFSSNGHKGMGNYDIFQIEGNPDDGWDETKNVGYPVNSGADDYFYYQIPLADSAFGFFSSNRVTDNYDSVTYDNVYRFFKAPYDVILKGRVYAASNNQAIENASIKIIKSKTNEVVKQTITGPGGTYKVVFPREDKAFYDVEITAKGYMFFNKKLRFINGKYVPMETLMVVSEEESSDPNVNIINFPLKELSVGSKIVLKNIYFEFNKSVLQKESYGKLERVAQFLQQNPEIRVEIAGHTDNIGSFAYNVKLSNNRAKSVVDYLVSEGVDRNRLSARGYSFEYPIAPNSTAEGRAQNRRVEFEIIDKE
jgi:outer membrane protein OmpA-like peptidoglycan-associated protein